MGIIRKTLTGARRRLARPADYERSSEHRPPLDQGPVCASHAEARTQLHAILNAIRGSDGLPGIAFAADLLELGSTEPALEAYTRAAQQFEFSASLVRDSFAAAIGVLDRLHSDDWPTYYADLFDAIEAHDRLMTFFCSAADGYLAGPLSAVVTNAAVRDRLKGALQKTAARSREIHPEVEGRLQSWRREVGRAREVESAPSSERNAGDVRGSGISVLVGADGVSIHLRRNAGDSPDSEIVLTIGCGRDAKLTAARCADNLRAMIEAEPEEILGPGGEIHDLSILQELSRIGRVTAQKILFSKRMAGQVFSSVDFRGCIFSGCNLRAADFSGCTFDSSTEFIDCVGLNHARFDSFLELHGISTVPRAARASASRGILSRLRSAIGVIPRSKRLLTAEEVLTDLRQSEHFQSSFQITDVAGIQVSPQGKRVDALTVHFSGGCVLVSKVPGSATHLKAEVFQRSAQGYEQISNGGRRVDDSPLYLSSAEQVLRWVADVCNQYPLRSARFPSNREGGVQHAPLSRVTLSRAAA